MQVEELASRLGRAGRGAGVPRPRCGSPQVGRRGPRSRRGAPRPRPPGRRCRTAATGRRVYPSPCDALPLLQYPPRPAATAPTRRCRPAEPAAGNPGTYHIRRAAVSGRRTGPGRLIRIDEFYDDRPGAGPAGPPRPVRPGARGGPAAPPRRLAGRMRRRRGRAAQICKDFLAFAETMAPELNRQVDALSFEDLSKPAAQAEPTRVAWRTAIKVAVDSVNWSSSTVGRG